MSLQAEKLAADLAATEAETGQAQQELGSLAAELQSAQEQVRER